MSASNTFNAIRGNLSAIRDFVETKATEAGADADEIYEITAAVDEAATNVIIHGYKDKGGPLEVEVVEQPGAVTVTLRDQAPHFNPTTIPTPDLSQPIEARPLGGMGFHIVRKYTHSIEYHALPDGNELILTRKIG